MKLKKWAALLLVGVMVFSLAGCLGNFYETVMTVDGEPIPAGIYLSLQYNAHSEAEKKAADPDKDVLKQNIEGVPAAEWIRSRTEELCRKYICVRRLCEEREMVLNDTNTQYLDESMGYWDMTKTYYERNGIGYNSLKSTIANGLLADQLFETLYGEGGELAPEDAVMMEQYAEQNAHIEYIMVPVNENETKVDMSEQVYPFVEKMLGDLEAGDEMDAVAEKYMEDVYKTISREYTDTTAANSVSSSYVSYTPSATDTTYTPEFLEELKAQAVGDYGIYKMESLYLVYKKVPVFKDQTSFSSMRSTVVKSLYTEDFNNYLRSIYEAYPVDKTFGAVWYYSPSKIK